MLRRSTTRCTWPSDFSRWLRSRVTFMATRPRPARPKTPSKSGLRPLQVGAPIARAEAPDFRPYCLFFEHPLRGVRFPASDRRRPSSSARPCGPSGGRWCDPGRRSGGRSRAVSARSAIWRDTWRSGAGAPRRASGATRAGRCAAPCSGAETMRRMSSMRTRRASRARTRSARVRSASGDA